MTIKTNCVCCCLCSLLVFWQSSMRSAGSQKQLTNRWWRSYWLSIQDIPSSKSQISARRQTSVFCIMLVVWITSVTSGCSRTWTHWTKMSFLCYKSRLPISQGPSGKTVRRWRVLFYFSFFQTFVNL